MEMLSADEVRGLVPSTIDLATLGLAEGDPDPLEQPVAIAQAQLPGMIGWTLDALPAHLEPLAKRAIVLLALRQSADLTADRLETLADFDLLSAMSVGSYSETRRSPEDALKLQAMGLTGWPGLDSILIGLMSPDRRDEFLGLLNGTNAPAFEITEPDWQAAWVDPPGSLGDLWD